MQRCLFLQHLLSWRQISAALVRCRKNLSSLRLNFGASVEKGSCKQRLAGAVKGQKCAFATVAEKKATGQTFVLPHPQDVELTPNLRPWFPELRLTPYMVYGESALPSAESYHKLLSLPRLLDLWLMALDADAAGKQKGALYKGLYKCVFGFGGKPLSLRQSPSA